MDRGVVEVKWTGLHQQDRLVQPATSACMSARCALYKTLAEAFQYTRQSMGLLRILI